MKTLFFAFAMVLVSAKSFADIEYLPTESSKPTAARVASNRACFKELENQGCGDPGEDIEHFRSCMNNSYASLTDSCRTLMTRLYGKK